MQEMWEGARQRNWRERLGIYTAAARSFLWAGTVCRMSQTQRKSLTLGTVSVAPKGAHIRIDVTRDHITMVWSLDQALFSNGQIFTCEQCHHALGQHKSSLGDFMTTRGSLSAHSTRTHFPLPRPRQITKVKFLRPTHIHRLTCSLASEAADLSHRRATQTKARRPSASCIPNVLRNIPVSYIFFQNAS